MANSIPRTAFTSPTRCVTRHCDFIAPSMAAAAKGVIINTSLKYIDKNRRQLSKQYASFEDFRAGFNVPQEVVDDVVAEAEKQNVKPKNDEELQQTLPMLRTQLKALIARDLWDMNEYFAIINEQNHIVQRALQILDQQ